VSYEHFLPYVVVEPNAGDKSTPSNGVRPSSATAHFPSTIGQSYIVIKFCLVIS